MATSGNNFSDELESIIDQEDFKELADFIEKLKSEEIEDAKELLSQADRYHEKFGRVSRLSTAVMELPKSDITEIKSFKAPPKGVKEVLQAFFIMLGHSPSEVKDYAVIKKLLGDAECLKKVQNVKLKDLSKEQARAAKLLLDNYTYDRIKSISKAALTMQQWCIAMIEESAELE